MKSPHQSQKPAEVANQIPQPVPLQHSPTHVTGNPDLMLSDGYVFNDDLMYPDVPLVSNDDNPYWEPPSTHLDMDGFYDPHQPDPLHDPRSVEDFRSLMVDLRSHDNMEYEEQALEIPPIKLSSFTCKSCGKSVAYKRSLFRHYTTCEAYKADPTNPQKTTTFKPTAAANAAFKCADCNKELATKRNLNRHRNTCKATKAADSNLPLQVLEHAPVLVQVAPASPPTSLAYTPPRHEQTPKIQTTVTYTNTTTTAQKGDEHFPSESSSYQEKTVGEVIRAEDKKRQRQMKSPPSTCSKMLLDLVRPRRRSPAKQEHQEGSLASRGSSQKRKFAHQGHQGVVSFDHQRSQPASFALRERTQERLLGRQQSQSGSLAASFKDNGLQEESFSSQSTSQERFQERSNASLAPQDPLVLQAYQERSNGGFLPPMHRSPLQSSQTGTHKQQNGYHSPSQFGAPSTSGPTYQLQRQNSKEPHGPNESMVNQEYQGSQNAVGHQPDQDPRRQEQPLVEISPYQPSTSESFELSQRNYQFQISQLIQEPVAKFNHSPAMRKRGIILLLDSVITSTPLFAEANSILSKKSSALKRKGPIPYLCPECDKKLSSSSSVTRHRTEVHKMTSDEIRANPAVRAPSEPGQLTPSDRRHTVAGVKNLPSLPKMRASKRKASATMAPMETMEKGIKMSKTEMEKADKKKNNCQGGEESEEVERIENSINRLPSTTLPQIHTVLPSQPKTGYSHSGNFRFCPPLQLPSTAHSSMNIPVGIDCDQVSTSTDLQPSVGSYLDQNTAESLGSNIKESELNAMLLEELRHDHGQRNIAQGNSVRQETAREAVAPLDLAQDHCTRDNIAHRNQLARQDSTEHHLAGQNSVHQEFAPSNLTCENLARHELAQQDNLEGHTTQHDLIDYVTEQSRLTSTGEGFIPLAEHDFTHQAIGQVRFANQDPTSQGLAQFARGTEDDDVEACLPQSYSSQQETVRQDGARASPYRSLQCSECKEKFGTGHLLGKHCATCAKCQQRKERISRKGNSLSPLPSSSTSQSESLP